ncbi:MAG: dihydroorotate dehydrogenase-like protein [Bacteroidales bacterium]|nr:dihydroorotate dehydrogenase-like protein [Bacteroidales bacterium]
MADLSTKYLGLTLKNPVIVGSCELTSSVENIKKMETAGAAAVVLKSIFEEEILLEVKKYLDDAAKNSLIYTELSETLDYIDLHTKQETLNNYLDLVKKAKKETLIPIIASINCVSDSEWVDFAEKIQAAGADALELNIFLNPTDSKEKDFEKTAINIIKKVLKKTSIPVAVKLSNCFTNLAHTLVRISETGVAGMVLFNRFYSPDIDIDYFYVMAANKFSSPDEFVKPLRYMALLSDKVKCSLAASTGIHYGNTMIKQLLAGADAVQVVSTLYLNGIDYITTMLTDLENWMQGKGYFSIGQFKGKMSYKNIPNPALYERMQFMKHYSRIG